ncbi:hypothetical protein P9273_03560 [Mesorhizobium sp. WSM4935]|uniref:hypothetical protein n=1 Tax=Mesorhizobium sp. WSM4935 TaxID=3038547 RepID=UPI002414ED63|nr:hypothetical protein [Mesorhizobium sp. WSM4935]MDG4874175.1 hypothetical protein [Mesorhizobium sp. WSM4935]
MAAPCKHSGQFADLRNFADPMIRKALLPDLTTIMAFSSARGMMTMGHGISGKKKSHAEQIEHSHARVVR